MKEKIYKFIEIHKEELKELNRFLYNNPEESYNENKAVDYICNLLENHDFKVEKNFLELNTSFIATKGTGHPKNCFICEYDAIKDEGHLTGHNLLCTTSVSAALSLGNIIDEIGGSVTVIGCPGEYLGGTKSIMVKQGVFDDLDVVLMAHPDIITCESGTSSAIVPIKVKFLGEKSLSYLNEVPYTPLDAMLLSFNIINSLTKGFPKNVELNYVLSKGGFTPSLTPYEAEAKFYIRGAKIDLVRIIENKIREVIIYVSKLTKIQYSLALYEPENEELITNRTLNRLFSHNLKESGIISISDPRDTNSGLSLGLVSKKIPCIHPYFKVTNDENIKYGTKAFSEETISDHAMEEAFKCALALAKTGCDIIQKESLLVEVKNEFYK